MQVNMGNMPNPQKMFADRLNEKTYCPFGNQCSDSPTCDIVVTQQVIDEVNKLGKALVTFIQPPKACFKPNGRK